MSPIFDIGDEAKERVKNPIVGAFAISFFLFNWKSFSLLFLGNSPVENRLQAIEELGLVTWQPITVALAYVILMPWVSLVIEWARQFGTDRLIELKRGQQPRIELSEKLNADNMTFQDVLKLVHSKDTKKVKNAINKLRDVMMGYRDHLQRESKFEEKEVVQNYINEFDEGFQIYIGTPLRINKSDQTTDQQ